MMQGRRAETSRDTNHEKQKNPHDPASFITTSFLPSNLKTKKPLPSLSLIFSTNASTPPKSVTSSVILPLKNESYATPLTPSVFRISSLTASKPLYPLH